MLHITRVKKCPSCGHQHSRRRKRHLWMRLIPNSSHQKCDRCRASFVCISGISCQDEVQAPSHCS